MDTPRQPGELGIAAEKAAVRFLKKQGYTLLARNFSTRAGEIDIIAADGKTICFVEVRSRANRGLLAPHASVNRRKQARIRAAATRYLTVKRLHNRLCRFDVVLMAPAPEQKSGWHIELFRDAF